MDRVQLLSDSDENSVPAIAEARAHFEVIQTLNRLFPASGPCAGCGPHHASARPNAIIRPGNDVRIARRSSAGLALQLLISVIVRPQPRHQPVALSSVQTLTHGLARPTGSAGTNSITAEW